MGLGLLYSNGLSTCFQIGTPKQFLLKLSNIFHEHIFININLKSRYDNEYKKGKLESIRTFHTRNFTTQWLATDQLSIYMVTYAGPTS